MLHVWGRRTSSNVQAVLWTLAHLRVPFTQTDIGHKFGGNTTPAYLAMNPNGLVPVIRDGEHDEPIFEEAAIVRYLASKYGNDAFWPSDLAKRAQVDKWAEWAKINVAGGFTAPIFWKVVRTAPSPENTALAVKAVKALNKFLDIADAELAKKKYLAGDELTVADIQLGHVLFRYFDIDIERKEHKNLERYYKELTARDDYRENVMISYEDLRYKA